MNTNVRHESTEYTEKKNASQTSAMILKRFSAKDEL